MTRPNTASSSYRTPSFLARCPRALTEAPWTLAARRLRPRLPPLHQQHLRLPRWHLEACIPERVLYWIIAVLASTASNLWLLVSFPAA